MTNTIDEILDTTAGQIKALDVAEQVLSHALQRRPEILPMIHSYSAISIIALYLATGQFMKISYGFSHGLLLDILDYYQQMQDFETCAEIIKQIEEANAIFPFLMLATK